MTRIGVIGTLVWDRIHARDGRREPVEEWGGISYALAAFAARCPPEWQVVPILKVGRDLAEEAREFLGTFPRLELESGLRVVPQPNNRVELRYVDSVRRSERLTGGVPGWTWEELAPVVDDLDALYINFISGWELDLQTALHLRLGYSGPLYADLHSLFLGVGPDGRRIPRPLRAWREWLGCFDMVQMNEDELGQLAHSWGDPWQLAADVVGAELKLLLVTLGPRGAAYVASPAMRPDPLSWEGDGDGLEVRRPLGVPGAVTSEAIEPPGGEREGDPTGCGDVWGAACFASLLAGDDLKAAIRAANKLASRNVEHLGAAGLHRHLTGRIHA